MNYYKYIGVLFFWMNSLFSTAQVEELGTQNSLFYYTGSFGQSLKVELNLQVDDCEVSGSYIESVSGELYIFNGRMDDEKLGFDAQVYLNDNIYIASMQAKFVSDEGDFAKKISGVWISADGAQKSTINLRKVAEMAILRRASGSAPGD